MALVATRATDAIQKASLTRSPATRLSRDQNGIDHMDHAIGTGDVRSGDVHAVIQLNTVSGTDLDRCAIDRNGTFAIQGQHVSGHDLASHHVIGEDGLELGNVGEQRLDEDAKAQHFEAAVIKAFAEKPSIRSIKLTGSSLSTGRIGELSKQLTPGSR